MTNVPLHACLCDIWHDHVLFTVDKLTGLVDYGSVKVDNIKDLSVQPDVDGALVGGASLDIRGFFEIVTRARPMPT